MMIELVLVALYTGNFTKKEERGRKYIYEMIKLNLETFIGFFVRCSESNKSIWFSCHF